MGTTIAVMNTKGGVGKSTLVMALAETLSAYHGKNVLVIDSDSQASVSSMFMTSSNLHKLQSSGLTIVDYLVASVLNDTEVEWPGFVIGGVSDVDDAKSVYVLPSDMQLTLLEREVSKESLHTRLRKSIAGLLRQTQDVFDIVLIDCPPGLSVLTECWLRESVWHISPTKADYVSSCGLEVFRRFKSLNPEMGFAQNLGVLVNMLDAGAVADADYLQWIASNEDNRCFSVTIPRSTTMQHAAHYRPGERSYMAKYPGDAGLAIRKFAAEVLERLAAAPIVRAETPPPIVSASA
ncbi:MAG: ParA family protein [Pseudomonadota bacterium]